MKVKEYKRVGLDTIKAIVSCSECTFEKEWTGSVHKFERLFKEEILAETKCPNCGIKSKIQELALNTCLN